MTRLGGPADGTLKNGSLFSGKAGSAVPTTPEALSEAPSAPPSGVQLRSPHPSVWSESKFTLIAIIHTVPHQLESRRPLGGPNWEELPGAASVPEVPARGLSASPSWVWFSPVQGEVETLC